MSVLTNAYTGLLMLLDEVNWTFLRAAMRLSAVLVFVGMVVQGPVADPLDQNNQTLAIVRGELFDFTTWEANAVLDKTRASLAGAHTYMDEPQREQVVRDYLALVDEIQWLEDEVTYIYIDPAVTDPESATADLRAERDALRHRQAELQPVAEAIIQSQIAATLVDLGFGTVGHIMPPVWLRFTQPPRLLVVSPRDRIERTGNHPLQHDLTVDEQEQLERDVDRQLDVSSLSVPLGGLAVYPAMLIETGYAEHVFTTGAHEWAHHSLSFYPLGYNFGATPDLFTMNETVASIIGDEVGRLTLERYYPDLAPPPPLPPADSDAPPPPEAEPEPPVFDFRAEMRATRVQVDTLLAEGRVEEAEAYMEERRAVFVEQDYNIRKLNQAYFAFYGSYADQPGATGSDPVGPSIRELRALSPSLVDFVRTMRSLTTFEDLEQAIEARGPANP
jgi:hypothetical protein